MGMVFIVVCAGTFAVARKWNGRADASPVRVLRIGYAVEAPYAYVDAQGRVTGESPEIARVIAARMGIKEIVWRQTEFTSLIRELEDGRIDVIAAGMFITPQRSERVAFSRPTFRVATAMLVAKGNPLKLHSLEEAAARGARVAALAGSVEEQTVRGLVKSTSIKLVTVAAAEDGKLAISEGHADAFALSAPSLNWLASHGVHAEVELATPFQPPPALAVPAVGGFAFRRGDRELRARWNEELARYVGSSEHLSLVRPLGFTEADLPTGRENETAQPSRP